MVQKTMRYLQITMLENNLCPRAVEPLQSLSQTMNYFVVVMFLFFLRLIHTQISQNLWIFNAFSMLMLMLVCLHEVVHKNLISSFQLQEGPNRKTILLAKVTLTTSIIGPALNFCDTVPLRHFIFFMELDNFDNVDRSVH